MKTSLSAYINLKKERERSSVNRSQNLNMCVAINGGEIVGISFIAIESMIYVCWFGWFVICTSKSILAR